MLDDKERDAGVYIFSSKIFKKLERPAQFNLDERLKCIDCSKYVSSKKYLDIGTHQGLKYAKESNLFKG